MKSNAFGKERGWIELICGPMFAGKSEELLRKLKRLDYADVDYLIFKPKLDTRSHKSILSRDGRKMESIDFENSFEILEYVLEQEKMPHVVAIDEAQFADDDLVDVCDALADIGLIVYVSALDKNFKNEPFMVTARLACIAEHVNKLSAICTECGAPGTVSQRMVNDKPSNYDAPIVQIGDYESYTVRCRHHHKVPGKPINEKIKNFKTSFKQHKKQEKEQEKQNQQ